MGQQDEGLHPEASPVLRQAFADTSDQTDSNFGVQAWLKDSSDATRDTKLDAKGNLIAQNVPGSTKRSRSSSDRPGNDRPGQKRAVDRSRARTPGGRSSAGNTRPDSSDGVWEKYSAGATHVTMAPDSYSGGKGKSSGPGYYHDWKTGKWLPDQSWPVSYTHLTLPTN